MKLRYQIKYFLWLLLPVFLIISIYIYRRVNKTTVPTISESTYIGSGNCRPCHEKFYNLWAPSHHGQALQNITREFIQEFFPNEISGNITIGKSHFHVEAFKDSLIFIEDQGRKTVRYPATFAIGGKNVFYFLTSFYKGRLQVLPLAYDRNRKEWYDNPKSALRQFPEGEKDEVLPWKHSAYTFNTSCWGCHVSQLSDNYDPATNTYHTTWRENGINCETCHGPSGDHVKVCEEADEGTVPVDLKIISAKSFDHAQQNANCGSCHAKMRPITSNFKPGGNFFDYFDLTTLESSDFYPDGRDLGENYTYTSWLQSKCIRDGNLDCIHCHTSSGRFRFADQNKNEACLPCHEKQVEHVGSHSHHKESSEGAICISCHMPKTEFARMYRSDHSMRPPSPLASGKFGSPNACNICHEDKSNEWSQKYLVEWNKNDHQEEILKKGNLISEARQHNWKNLGDMLKAIGDYQSDEVFITSMIRLMQELPDEKKWPVILQSLNHSSPLVRSAAARSLSGLQSDEAVNGLLKASDDSCRLVRIASAEALSYLPPEAFEQKNRQPYNDARDEYISSVTSRDDDWSSHATLGNYYFNRNEYDKALAEYRFSLKLFPDNAAALVNSGFVYTLKGDLPLAEIQFRKAIDLEPDNEGAHLNYALLLSEMQRYEEAGEHFKKVLKINPHSGVAAYNLSVIESGDDLMGAIQYARKAVISEPENPKYAYTLGYYLYMGNQFPESEKVLEGIIRDFPLFGESYLLLYEVYRKSGKITQAIKLAGNALNNPDLDDNVRMRLQKLSQGIVQ